MNLRIGSEFTLLQFHSFRTSGTEKEENYFIFLFYFLTQFFNLDAWFTSRAEHIQLIPHYRLTKTNS